MAEVCFGKSKNMLIGCGGKPTIIEKQAWGVGADSAFGGNLLGTIAEILYQKKSISRSMLQRRQKSQELNNTRKGHSADALND